MELMGVWSLKRLEKGGRRCSAAEGVEEKSEEVRGSPTSKSFRLCQFVWPIRGDGFLSKSVVLVVVEGFGQSVGLKGRKGE